MTDARRYREQEIGEIFEAAASPRPAEGRSLSPVDGLTLAELQEIGREVGVEPQRIADAARALDLRPSALSRRTDLGMPVSVGRTVDLPRPPTDREWEVLVAEMRETFRARGKDRSHGGLRQWTNGNLHALVEPTQDGYRLRIGTSKGDAVPVNRLGIAGMVMALVLLVALFLTGSVADDPTGALVLGALGAGTVAYNAFRLSGWALEREEQMEHVAARARTLIGAPRDAGAEDGGRPLPAA